MQNLVVGQTNFAIRLKVGPGFTILECKVAASDIDRGEVRALNKAFYR